MTRIEVLEPALCCNIGVCGDDVDQALVTFTADMGWINSQGGDVARFSLVDEPLAFAEREPVKASLQLSGSEGFFLVLVEQHSAATGFRVRCRSSGRASVCARRRARRPRPRPDHVRDHHRPGRAPHRHPRWQPQAI